MDETRLPRFELRDPSLIMGREGGGGGVGGKLGAGVKKNCDEKGGLPKVFRLMRGGGVGA